MKVLQYIYNSKIIDFSVENQNVMINATQMAQVFDKRVDVFLKTDHAQQYIKALENHLKNQNKLPPFGGSLEAKVVDFRGRNGVFFERRLALKFATWLDVEFELWVYTTIDKLILGQFKELKDATTEKLKIQNQLEQKRQELLEKHPTDFAEFLRIEKQLNQADKRRLKALKQSTEQLQLELFKG